MYICYYEGKNELWSKTLAKRVKELLGAYGLERTYDADNDVIKDMGDDELRQILKKQSVEFPNWAQWIKETTRFKVGEDTDIVAAVTLILEKYWNDKIVSSMAQLKCSESMKDYK